MAGGIQPLVGGGPPRPPARFAIRVSEVRLRLAIEQAQVDGLGDVR